MRQKKSPINLSANIICLFVLVDKKYRRLSLFQVTGTDILMLYYCLRMLIGCWIISWGKSRFWHLSSQISAQILLRVRFFSKSDWSTLSTYFTSEIVLLHKRMYLRTFNTLWLTLEINTLDKLLFLYILLLYRLENRKQKNCYIPWYRVIWLHAISLEFLPEKL